MITAKEARAKTEEKANELLVTLSLADVENRILKEAATGGSNIDWDFGDNRKLGFEVKNRLENLGYKTELFNN